MAPRHHQKEAPSQGKDKAHGDLPGSDPMSQILQCSPDQRADILQGVLANVTFTPVQLDQVRECIGAVKAKATANVHPAEDQDTHIMSTTQVAAESADEAAQERTDKRRLVVDEEYEAYLRTAATVAAQNKERLVAEQLAARIQRFRGHFAASLEGNDDTTVVKSVLTRLETAQSHLMPLLPLHGHHALEPFAATKAIAEAYVQVRAAKISAGSLVRMTDINGQDINIPKDLKGHERGYRDALGFRIMSHMQDHKDRDEYIRGIGIAFHDLLCRGDISEQDMTEINAAINLSYRKIHTPGLKGADGVPIVRKWPENVFDRFNAFMSKNDKETIEKGKPKRRRRIKNRNDKEENTSQVAPFVKAPGPGPADTLRPASVTGHTQENLTLPGLGMVPFSLSPWIQQERQTETQTDALKPMYVEPTGCASRWLW